MTVKEWKRKNLPIKRKPITNGDHIRAMSDEELEDWIWRHGGCGSCDARKLCLEKPFGYCKNTILEWLKQEAGE